MLNPRQYDSLLKETERGPRERIDAWQRQQLVSILRHARDTVPFYRFRLQKLFRPDGTVDWNRWAELPVLTRADLRDHGDAIVSRRPIPAHGIGKELTSSGSTGTSVRFTPTGWMLSVAAAGIWRSSRWQRVDWSKTLLVRDYLLPGSGPEVEPRGPWGPVWEPGSTSGKTLLMSGERSLEGFYDAIRRYKPAYVSAGANAIHEILRMNRAAGNPAQIKAFFSRGAPILDNDEAWARESFGAKIIDLYSAKEGGSLAHRCPEHGTWHINEEAVLLEVVDRNGQAVPAGTEGRVVITPFTSTYMPLIRYDLGDLAVAGHPCTCGRTLRTMGEITGRTAHTFHHPDGIDTISPVMRLDPLKHRFGMGRWQVAQVGPTAFEVRRESPEPLAEETLAAFRAAFAAEIFPAEIRFINGADLSPRAGDKLLEYVNEWRSPAARRAPNFD